MKRIFGSWIFIVIMLALDFYVFQSLKLVTSSLSAKPKMAIHVVYWSFTVMTLILFLVIPFINFEQLPKFVRTYLFAILFGFFLAKLLAGIFFLLDDLRRVMQWGGSKAYGMFSGNNSVAEGGISRSIFLSWLGIGVGGGLFGTFIYGFGNKYRYQVRRQQLHFDRLPESFKGMKAIHISDIHSGSLDDKKAVEKGVQRILELEPDVIFFTGDLVNNVATEMDELKHVFAKLKAPLGVYSILGNHDYGDYVQWKSQDEKAANLERLKQVHHEMGWNLLLNEHRVIERGNDKIALIGIENWGAKVNFSRYGDLKKAYTGTEELPFKLLLSHDPSHWEAEVCKGYQDIDLMLSGHTHGMQFGVEIPGFRWSPVQYVYRQWAGLYRREGQKLYVNRGFGFLGYPGRVGILPEITLLEFV